MNVQKGGIPTQRKSTKAKASKALTTVAEGAIEKPVAAPAISAESMSIDLSGYEDTEMKLLRRSMRSKAKPETYKPDGSQPKKSRGTLTAEQKAARNEKAAEARAARLAQAAKLAQIKEEARGEQMPSNVPTQAEQEAIEKERWINSRTNEILASRMEEDKKRPSRQATNKVEQERLKAAARAQATAEYNAQQREAKAATAAEADALADLFGQMTTTRPVVTPTLAGQAIHSSGHPIVGYDPRDGWPLGVNPVTGQIERFATKDGGKKKRTYKKKSKPQKGGEVEGAAENEASLPAPVAQEGGKKKRTYKKKSKPQKGGEVEGAVAENEASLPAPVDQSGGKKKRTYKKKSKSQKGGIPPNDEKLPSPKELLDRMDDPEPEDEEYANARENPFKTYAERMKELAEKEAKANAAEALRESRGQLGIVIGRTPVNVSNSNNPTKKGGKKKRTKKN